MALQQIRPELLNEWRKKGDLIAIWRCERCYHKIPFFKQNPFIDNISLAWAHNHKYCLKCEKIIKGMPTKKKEKIPRINRLLKKYEFYDEIEEDSLYIFK